MSAILIWGRRYSLVVFFVLAFAISSPLFFLSGSGASVMLQLALFLLGSYAPAIAALIALAIAQDPVEASAFRKRLGLWRVPGRWYLAAALLPSLAWLLAVGLIALLRTGLTIQVTGFLFFPVILVINYGEEIGWRGYALPRLMERFRPLTASLILGVIWGVFHLPLYWQRPGFAALFCVLMLAISVIQAWLFIHSGGSVVITTLCHAVINAWSQAFLAPEGTDDLFATLVALVWVAVAVLILIDGSRLTSAKAAQA